MAKVYLFRQLSALNQQQSEVREEAIASVLDDVFKGNTSTIFNYCNWPVLSSTVDQCDDQDLLGRLLNELFSRVYNLGLSISINHMLIDGQSKRLSVECFNPTTDQFVANPIAAYFYMRTVVNQLRCNFGALFTICVRQTQLEGRLQLVHLQQSNHLKLATPLGSLVKLLAALAQNEKTHLRYYNIRLEAILKELLGPGKSSVIINYTMLPQRQLEPLRKVAICTKLWRALYKRQFRLQKQLKGLEFRSSKAQQLQLEDNSTSLKCESRKHQINQVESQQSIELPFRLDAQVNIDNMLELQDIVAKLASDLQQHMQQLEQKNNTISQLHELLAKANGTVQEQRLIFQRNLAFYAEMFKRLWQQQSNTLRLQEQQRDEQLSQMFDTICTELHSALLPPEAGTQTTVQLAERRCKP